MKMKTIGVTGAALMLAVGLCGCGGVFEGVEETSSSQVAESPYAPAIAADADTGADVGTTEGDAYVEEAEPGEYEEAEVTYYPEAETEGQDAVGGDNLGTDIELASDEASAANATVETS